MSGLFNKEVKYVAASIAIPLISNYAADMLRETCNGACEYLDEHTKAVIATVATTALAAGGLYYCRDTAFKYIPKASVQRVWSWIKNEGNKVFPVFAKNAAIAAGGALIAGPAGAVSAVLTNAVVNHGNHGNHNISDSEAQKQIRQLQRKLDEKQTSLKEIEKDLVHFRTNNYNPRNDEYRRLASKYEALQNEYVFKEADFKEAVKMIREHRATIDALRNTIKKQDSYVCRLEREMNIQRLERQNQIRMIEDRE